MFLPVHSTCRVCRAASQTPEALMWGALLCFSGAPWSVLSLASFGDRGIGLAAKTGQEGRGQLGLAGR